MFGLIFAQLVPFCQPQEHRGEKMRPAALQYGQSSQQGVPTFFERKKKLAQHLFVRVLNPHFFACTFLCGHKLTEICHHKVSAEAIHDTFFFSKSGRLFWAKTKQLRGIGGVRVHSDGWKHC